MLENTKLQIIIKTLYKIYIHEQKNKNCVHKFHQLF
jgi:hypothetical protein